MANVLHILIPAMLDPVRDYMIAEQIELISYSLPQSRVGGLQCQSYYWSNRITH